MGLPPGFRGKAQRTPDTQEGGGLTGKGAPGRGCVAHPRHFLRLRCQPALGPCRGPDVFLHLHSQEALSLSRSSAPNVQQVSSSTPPPSQLLPPLSRAGLLSLVLPWACRSLVTVRAKEYPSGESWCSGPTACPLWTFICCKHDPSADHSSPCDFPSTPCVILLFIMLPGRAVPSLGTS